MTSCGPDLLNPALYAALRNFTGQLPTVTRRGQPARVSKQWSRSPSGEFLYRDHTVETGEEYHLDCPICGDRQRRLSVNHRFGAAIDESDRPCLHTLNCFRRGCFSDHDKRRWLYDQLFGWNAGLAPALQTQYAEVSAEEMLAKPITMAPGTDLRALSCLRQTQPQHVALTYLEGRGFSPEYLEQRWGVSWCEYSPEHRMLTDRIFIPLVMHGQLYGFQGRSPHDVNRRGCPKYWNLPGMRREQMLYGIDGVRGSNFVVLVEGAADAWRVDWKVCALLGNKISRQQIELLFNLLPEYFHIILLLDPKQDEASRERGRPHHIDAAREHLAMTLDGGWMRVHVVRLPEYDGCDPGSLDHRFLWGYIAETLRNEPGNDGQLPAWFSFPYSG